MSLPSLLVVSSRARKVTFFTNTLRSSTTLSLSSWLHFCPQGFCCGWSTSARGETAQVEKEIVFIFSGSIMMIRVLGQKLISPELQTDDCNLSRYSYESSSLEELAEMLEQQEKVVMMMTMMTLMVVMMMTMMTLMVVISMKNRITNRKR